MHMPPSNRITFKNRLLAALPREELERFSTELYRLSLPQREVIYEAGAPIEYVYFVEEGLSSVLTTMTDGSTIEVGMVGMEGMVGVSALLGGESSVQQVIMQIAGSALRMNAARCKAAFDQSAAVRRVMLRFTEAVLNLGAQTATCMIVICP
jgi:CRP-like cAMP-binding protein